MQPRWATLPVNPARQPPRTMRDNRPVTLCGGACTPRLRPRHHEETREEVAMQHAAPIAVAALILAMVAGCSGHSSTAGIPGPAAPTSRPDRSAPRPVSALTGQARAG